MTHVLTATVFGGSGFLGHAVVQALAVRGYIVRVPTRDLEKAKDLKVLGATGQVVPFRASVRSDASVQIAMAGSDVVINLIGLLAEKNKNQFQTMHVETPARLARLAHATGAKHFIHVSALGADPRAASRYAQTKALGEEAVRAFFPDAVILRPSVMFGPRDLFLGRFARLARFMPFLPLIGGGQTKFQPVYVGDVAAAILASIDRPEAKGRLFSLGGPEVFSFKELMELLLKTMNVQRRLLVTPWWLANIQAAFLEKLPTPLLTRDQIKLLKTDNVVPPHAKGKHMTGPGFIEDLGIKPTKLTDILKTYVGAQ